MDDKLSIKIEKMLKKSEIILNSGKNVRRNRPLKLNHLLWLCGTCSQTIISHTFVYCPYCGTKIDWN